MSKPPVPFAPETLETIQRAFRLATDLRHDTVGLEHLLIAIADEPQARRILVACGADLNAMKRQLEDVLAKAFTPMSPEEMQSLSSEIAATHKAALDHFFYHHHDC